MLAPVLYLPDARPVPLFPGRRNRAPSPSPSDWRWSPPPLIRQPLSAITVTAVTSGTGSGTSAISASISLSAGEVGFFAVFGYDTGGGGPTTPTMSGWTQVGTTQAHVSPNYPTGVTIFRRAGSFSGTQSIAFTNNQGYILWQVVKCSGSRLTGTNAADAVRQTISGTSGASAVNNITASFTTFTPTLNGNVILAWHADWNVNTITPRTNFSSLYHQADGNIATCATTYRATGTDTAVSHTASGSAQQGIFGIEIAAASPPPRTGIPYAVMVQ